VGSADRVAAAELASSKHGSGDEFAVKFVTIDGMATALVQSANNA